MELSGLTGTLYHPGFGQQLHYRIDVVSDDPDTQCAQVLALMASYVRTDTASPEIRMDAAFLRDANMGADPVAGVFNWVRSRMHFVRDEDTGRPVASLVGSNEDVAEVLIRPRDMSVASRAQGDCDDYVMYGAALLRASGIKINFCTVAADPQLPRNWSHVYCVAYPGGQRTPVDFSHGPYVGWEVTEGVYRRREWSVDVPVSTESSINVLALVAAVGGAAYLLAKGLPV